MNLSNRIRANIRFLIEARGYTYRDLGWPRNYVSDVVNGECGLSLDRVDEFAKRLKVDVSELTKEPRQ